MYTQRHGFDSLLCKGSLASASKEGFVEAWSLHRWTVLLYESQNAGIYELLDFFHRVQSSSPVAVYPVYQYWDRPIFIVIRAFKKLQHIRMRVDSLI
jgi:hypothetical protein